MNAQSSGNPLRQLEDFLELYLVKKAPFQLPEGVKEFIVKFGPWIDLVLIIIFLPLLIGLLGLGSMFSFMLSSMGRYGMMGYYGGWSLYTIIGIVALVLEALALPGLFKRSKTGWNLIFYADIVLIVQNIISFDLGGIISGIIGFYFLFQIRSYYK